MREVSSASSCGRRGGEWPGRAALDAHPSDADLHEIRKRASEPVRGGVAAGALHEDAGGLAERLADLQDVFGEVQDAVVAKDRLSMFVDEAGSPGSRRSRPDSSSASKTKLARTHAIAGRPHGKRRGPSASVAGSADPAVNRPGVPSSG